MKLNMKRVALGLTMAVCLFSLSACSTAGDTTASETDEIDASVQSQLKQLPDPFLNLYVELQDSDVSEFKKNMEGREEYAGIVDGVDTWAGIKNDLGALVSVEENVLVENTADGYVVTLHTVFEKRNMDFSITTDPEISKIISVSFAPEYTTGEKLQKGDYNGPIGLGIIALLLVLLGLFKYIAVSKNGNGESKKAVEPVFVPGTPDIVPIQEEEEELADDLELAAVITAAIAASTGSSPNGLVVRSIRRAPAGKWKNA
ncbi:OadG family transporter subunit [Lachnospiraceae bacterium 54-53]